MNTKRTAYDAHGNALNVGDLVSCSTGYLFGRYATVKALTVTDRRSVARVELHLTGRTYIVPTDALRWIESAVDAREDKGLPVYVPSEPAMACAWCGLAINEGSIAFDIDGTAELACGPCRDSYAAELRRGQVDPELTVDLTAYVVGAWKNETK